MMNSSPSTKNNPVSQRQLSRDLGMSDSYVNAVERGLFTPSEKVLDRLQEILNEKYESHEKNGTQPSLDLVRVYEPVDPVLLMASPDLHDSEGGDTVKLGTLSYSVVGEEDGRLVLERKQGHKTCKYYVTESYLNRSRGCKRRGGSYKDYRNYYNAEGKWIRPGDHWDPQPGIDKGNMNQEKLEVLYESALQLCEPLLYKLANNYKGWRMASIDIDDLMQNGRLLLLQVLTDFKGDLHHPEFMASVRACFSNDIVTQFRYSTQESRDERLTGSSIQRDSEGDSYEIFDDFADPNGSSFVPQQETLVYRESVDSVRKEILERFNSGPAADALELYDAIVNPPTAVQEALHECYTSRPGATFAVRAYAIGLGRDEGWIRRQIFRIRQAAAVTFPEFNHGLKLNVD